MYQKVNKGRIGAVFGFRILCFPLFHQRSRIPNLMLHVSSRTHLTLSGQPPANAFSLLEMPSTSNHPLRILPHLSLIYILSHPVWPGATESTPSASVLLVLLFPTAVGLSQVGRISGKWYKRLAHSRCLVNYYPLCLLPFSCVPSCISQKQHPNEYPSVVSGNSPPHPRPQYLNLWNKRLSPWSLWSLLDSGAFLLSGTHI